MRKHRTLVTVLGLGILLAGCAAEPEFRLRRVAVDPAGGGDATLSPDGRRIVTTSRRTGNWDLWIFDIPTGRWRQVTNDPAEDFEARWSPDGRRLVFTSTRSGRKNIWVIGAEGGTATRLTTSEDEDEYPAWSPDGRDVVYTGGPWGRRDYFLVPAGGGVPRKLSRESGRAGACAFESRGASLVCHRYDLGSGDVVRLSLEGELSPLTLGSPWDYKPSPSADGAWIAFSRSEEGPSYIGVMPARGGKVRRLTRSPHDDRWPTWSGSGHTLLFHRLVDRSTGLKLLDRASGRVRTLVAAAEEPLQGALDPSGERLVYCAQEPDRKVLKIKDLQTGVTRRLPTGAGEACFPRWSPDGRRIAFAGKPGERWEVSVIDADGQGLVALTAGLPGLHGMDGPLDWAPDGSKLVFHADTEPFEADLYTIGVEDRSLALVTHDAWFDEAPSWDVDGEHVIFMSTRGGDWTWGLFRLSLADGTVETLAGPDWTEKNFPRSGPDGGVVWSVHDDRGKAYLAERTSDGEVRVRKEAGAGVRWPSFTTDGTGILFTGVEREVEYWLAEGLSGHGSPLLDQASEPETARPVRLAASVPETRPMTRSPVDMERR